jgi:hypothetical protein
MSKDIDIEWKDVEKKVEEDEFQKEKKAQYDEQQQQQQTEQNSEQNSEQDDADEYESLGLASMISEVWNEVAVDKGYEPVTEKQDAFLQRHTEKLEQKYLKDKMNMLPEVEAGLSHLVVYLPKWLKHKRETKTGDKK